MFKRFVLLVESAPAMANEASDRKLQEKNHIEKYIAGIDGGIKSTKEKW